MKKLILASAIASFIYASGEMYSDVVKPIFADATSDKTIGKLLPTNAVKILSKENGKAKIEVEGFLNPAVPNVIYFSDSQRVFTLAFAKTAKPEISVISKGKNGKWDRVKTIVYTTDSDFSDSVEPMFAKASELYKNNCGICHGTHATDHYKANQWPGLVKSMLSRTAIDKKDEWLIVQYLQKHSSDVKVK